MSIMPDYILKRSARSKQVSFRISMRNGLIITVPKRFNTALLPRYIQQKEGWINQHLAAVEKRKHTLGKVADGTLPEMITLPSLGQVIPVIYRHTTASSVKWSQHEEQLIIYGAIKDKSKCVAALSAWLQEYAKEHLAPWLAETSKRWNLPYKQLAIRGQIARWGSCSARHHISLNRKLLFVPADLVEYIFLHELCHTIHLNHSADFWQLVAAYDNDYKVKDQQTRKSAWYRYIPAWADG